MLYNPQIHSLSLLAKSFLGRMEKLRGGLSYPNNELLVLNYHSTPKKYLHCLKAQLRFLTKHFSLIAPADLGAYFAGTLQTSKCKVLLTFDDGLKNNLYAVQELNDHGLKAFFFVVPAFIDTPVAAQKDYYVKHIRPRINPLIDSAPEDFEAMAWDDLKHLASHGHCIGAHTLTHTLIARASNPDNSRLEIAGCKTRMEQSLGLPVNSFCSINDTLLSVGAAEKELIARHYQYHFTTIPGSNADPKDPLFIKRRNVECYWPTGAYLYALGKADLKRWRTRLAQYAAL